LNKIPFQFFITSKHPSQDALNILHRSANGLWTLRIWIIHMASPSSSYGRRRNLNRS